MKQTDKQFRDLMKAWQPEKAPVNFTGNVMDRIYAGSGKISEYKPVLNKWFLRSVYATISAFVVYAMFRGDPSGAENSFSVPDKLLSRLPQFDLSVALGVGEQITGLFNNMPSFFVIIFLSAALLLLLDQLFLKRRKYS